MAKQDDQYLDIKKDESNRRKELEKQITNLENRQQELQYYITLLDQNVKDFETLILHEKQQPSPNYQQINTNQIIISKNIELLTKVYTTYREYEDIKFKCRKEINDSSFKTTHLLNVSIRQLDEKTDKLSDGDFVAMLSSLTDMIKKQANTNAPSTNSDLENPLYKI